MLQNMVICVELQLLVEATTMLQLFISLNNMVIECCLFAMSTSCFCNINWLTGFVLHKYSHSITLLLAVSYVNRPGESSPCLADSSTCVRQAMAFRSDEDEESHERFGQGLAKAIFCLEKAMIERVNIWLPSWESTMYMVVPYMIYREQPESKQPNIVFWYMLVHIGTMLASHNEI